MIETPTVFILGAGASMPFRFPSGTELITQIANSCHNPMSIQNKLLLNMNHTSEEIQNFITSLSNSFLPSVDLFLEHNPQYISIGKKAIALTLLPEERTASLRVNNGDWLGYLYTHYLFGPLDTISKNKISFITLNYDRSVEQFLYTALTNSFTQETHEDIIKQINKIPIIHVYGTLGKLDWQTPGGISYDYQINEGERTQKHVMNAAATIKILSEKSGYEKNFRKANTIIDKATRVYLLGFGFHPENVNRLKLIDAWFAKKNMMATTFGKSTKEQQLIVKLFKPATRLPGVQSFNFRLKRVQCLEFLRNEVELG